MGQDNIAQKNILSSWNGLYRYTNDMNFKMQNENG
jgi:hypothetical protein